MLISALIVCALFICSSKILFEKKLVGAYIIYAWWIGAQTTFRFRFKANAEVSAIVPIKQF